MQRPVVVAKAVSFPVGRFHTEAAWAAPFVGWLRLVRRRSASLSCSLVPLLAIAAALPAQAQTISIASGNKQTAVVATVLPAPLVARVRTNLGTAQPGVTVVFKVTGGGGSLSQLSAVTDSSGNASTTLTLGTIAGTNNNTVSASATGIGKVTFQETAKADAPSKLNLTPVSTTGAVGVAITYRATIQDLYGNTATTATNAVAFSVSGIGGSFSPATAVTPTSGV